RVRPNLGLPLAEVRRLLPGRTVDDLGGVDLVDRQISRHRRDRRMLEPIARAGPHPGYLEDRRYMILVIDAVEFRLEMLRDVHLHDIDVRHDVPPCYGFGSPEIRLYRVGSRQDSRRAKVHSEHCILGLPAAPRLRREWATRAELSGAGIAAP